MDLETSDFSEKGKPIALLFGPNQWIWNQVILAKKVSL